MKKFFSFLAAALMTGSMAAGTLIDYNSTPTLPAGITISGTTKMANVKIHTNTDGVDCIQLANGYNASGVYNGNAIILHTEGGFKAGDTLKVAGFFNNSDETKVAKAEIFTVDADNNCTAVWTSQQFINGRTSAADPAIEAYVLAADMDSIMIGRNGGTGTNICKLSIVRPEAAPTTLATFSISSAEIVAGQVGDIALGTNGYGSQAVADPATWYTCAKGDYTFKGAKVCVATASNGGGIQMQGNASDVAKMGFFGNATAFNNIHSVKVVLRTTSTATYVPVFNIYTDSLGTTTALAAPDTVLTTEGGFKKFVYTYSYAEPGKFFNIKDDLAGALYIDSIYVTYEQKEEPATINYWLVGTAAENGWDQTAAMPMPGDSIVRHLAAGTYEFKVLTQEASWTGALGYANLNAEASSPNVFGSDNVAFELENEGDATIKVVDGQIVVLGNFKEQVQADYYIKFAGNGWTWVGMGQAPSGVYMYEGVWGGVGANLNTSMSDEGATWYPEADIFFGTEEMETLPVPAVGTVGYYVYIPDAEPTPMFCFLYEGTPAAWDGTVTLSKDTITSLADLEGITLTFNGAATLALLDEEGSSIALQNEDGSELYAMWAPLYGGTYVITDTVVTLNGWYTGEGTTPLPAESAIVYFEDYGSFIVDGNEEAYFETVEIAFEAAPATTYTITYTVIGDNPSHCGVTAGYFNESGDGKAFVAGANIVPDNMTAYVYITVIDGYTAEVKINDAAVTLTDNYWEEAVTADMTIEVIFTAPQPTPEHLYIIGDFQSWTPAAGIEMLPVAGEEGVFTYEYSYATNGYFAFITELSSDWAVVNAHRFGPATDGTVATIGVENPNTLVAAEAAFQIPGGDYIFTVDVVNMTFVAEEKEPTALHNVESVKATKVIENGKVVILKNGVRYNVLGAQF